MPILLYDVVARCHFGTEINTIVTSGDWQALFAGTASFDRLTKLYNENIDDRHRSDDRQCLYTLFRMRGNWSLDWAFIQVT